MILLYFSFKLSSSIILEVTAAVAAVSQIHKEYLFNLHICQFDYIKPSIQDQKQRENRRRIQEMKSRPPLCIFVYMLGQLQVCFGLETVELSKHGQAVKSSQFSNAPLNYEYNCNAALVVLQVQSRVSIFYILDNLEHD